MKFIGILDTAPPAQNIISPNLFGHHFLGDPRFLDPQHGRRFFWQSEIMTRRIGGNIRSETTSDLTNPVKSSSYSVNQVLTRSIRFHKA